MCYLCSIELIPIALKGVNVRVVVQGKLFNIELLFDQDSRGDQAHIVVGVLDNVVYELLSELLVLVHLEEPDVIKLCECSRNSYYKYKRGIKITIQKRNGISDP